MDRCGLLCVIPCGCARPSDVQLLQQFSWDYAKMRCAKTRKRRTCCTWNIFAAKCFGTVCHENLQLSAIEQLCQQQNLDPVQHLGQSADCLCYNTSVSAITKHKHAHEIFERNSRSARESNPTLLISPVWHSALQFYSRCAVSNIHRAVCYPEYFALFLSISKRTPGLYPEISRTAYCQVLTYSSFIFLFQCSLYQAGFGS